MTTAFVVLSVVVWGANHAVGLDRLAVDLGFGPGDEGPLGGRPGLAHAAERMGSRTSVGLAAAALLGVALLWRDWVVGVTALLAPLATFAVTEYLAKPLINDLVAVGARGYPSGHAGGVAAVAMSAVVLFGRRWGRAGAILVAPLAAAAVLAVSLGVLALELHSYPTDVAGGVALGGGLALSLTALLDHAASFVETRREGS
jgi:membrane-associated phospholipid phosphatase